MHHVLSNYVFGKHEDLALVNLYDKNPKKYSVSLGQHLTRLKRIYGDHMKDLGKMGAGLDPNAVIPGSDMANKIAPSGSDSTRDSPSAHSSTPVAGEWEVWLETVVAWGRVYAHVVIAHE
ncbi:hypothetical protein M422DRAFT_245280 [Sphaerobolus stellatus SS14]|nr:hypothetical protein M422DRAFT_245280 [Sphaerobolus stellatus SS14]